MNGSIATGPVITRTVVWQMMKSSQDRIVLNKS
jgi:hypothetical protein